MNQSLQELWESKTSGTCHKWVHYFEIYERYVNKFRNKNSTYLEIGVQRGGSLDLMHEWLGEAIIVGIDIDPGCKSLEQTGHNDYFKNNHKIHIGSQEDVAFLTEVATQHKEFDIIIDDGGHTSDQQIISFKTLWPYLKFGGVYIVEDLHCSQYWPRFQDNRSTITFLQFAHGLSEQLSLWHYDEQLFHNRYNIPPEQRDNMSLPFESFAMNEIFSIAYFDSIIAIEKRAITEPYQAIR